MNRQAKIRARAASFGALALIAGVPVVAAAASAKALSPTATFVVPVPDPSATAQVVQLQKSGDSADATVLAKMLAQSRAVWLTGLSSDVTQVKESFKLSSNENGAIPLFALYNIPGRDCKGYSAGGAQTTAAYEAWIDSIAQAIGTGSAVVILEPDALANLPSDCGYDASVNVAQATADRYTQLAYAISKLEALPGTLVYLDAGHSAWQAVGTMAQRLVQAGVQSTQGFFLNASNFQPTPQLTQYGTWVAKCIYYANNTAEGGWRVGHYDWCASQYYPASSDDFSTWGQTDAWYTANVDQAANPPSGPSALTHFVIDTSRNGQDSGNQQPKHVMDVYGAALYNQSASTVQTLENGAWCNQPNAGLGLRPTANTGNPLVDAYLWIKVVGESDGTCDSAGGARAWDYTVYTQPGWPTTAADQATFDPTWGLSDPAAGVWFPQEALQLAKLANPAL